MASSSPKPAFCPHCGRSTPQRVVLRQAYAETLYANDGEVMEDVPASYAVAVCDVCQQVVLYNRLGSSAEGWIPEATDLLWPKPRSLADPVPERVRNIYSEASRIRDIAPNAFAVQVRRALEALCADRGLARGALGKRLEQLVARGELPAALAEMSDVLRLLGNVGAHADSLEVHKGHVFALDEFFRAIVEYVYVAPQKVREFRKQLEALQDKKPGGV
jgi:hypothetical protein